MQIRVENESNNLVLKLSHVFLGCSLAPLRETKAGEKLFQTNAGYFRRLDLYFWLITDSIVLFKTLLSAQEMISRYAKERVS